MKKKHWLNNGKGIEWYHLIIVAALAGLIFYNAGLHKGTDLGIIQTQRCDNHHVILDMAKFIPNTITIHPCDTITFTNNDFSNHEIQDANNQTIISLPVGSTSNYTFKEQGNIKFHTEKYPEIMTINIEVI